MCYDVVTVLSCGCKHFEGVEFCHDAIFANNGRACPAEKRTARRHIRWESDPRETRSCGKDPCPTQLAKEHDEKLQQVRDEVALQYASGERRPNGVQLGRPGVWDEFEAKAHGEVQRLGQTGVGQDSGETIEVSADLEGNDNEEYHYPHEGSYTALDGATEAKGKAISNDELGYQPVSSDRPELPRKSSRYSPPPSAPIPIANPVIYPRRDSLDLGNDFDFEFDKGMVAIFGQGAGGPRRARAKTGPPRMGGKTDQFATDVTSDEEIRSLLEKFENLGSLDLGDKRYDPDADLRLVGTCDDEEFSSSQPGQGNDEAVSGNMGHSDQSAPSTASFKVGDTDQSKIQTESGYIHPSGSSGRITPNLNNSPMSPVQTSSSNRPSRPPWYSTNDTIVRERQSRRTSWVTKVINSGAPNMATSPSFAAHSKSLLLGESFQDQRVTQATQSPSLEDVAGRMTVPSPVFTQVGRERNGQGHYLTPDSGGMDAEECKAGGSPKGLTTSAKPGTPSPIRTPTKAVVRGQMRHFSTPDFTTPPRQGRSPDAISTSDFGAHLTKKRDSPGTEDQV
ncbi:hypothetical protein V8F20_010309 [Naviculisporaceae sp. PSN 640]